MAEPLEPEAQQSYRPRRHISEVPQGNGWATQAWSPTKLHARTTYLRGVSRKWLSHSNLKPNKATCPDDLSPRFRKEMAEPLKPEAQQSYMPGRLIWLSRYTVLRVMLLTYTQAICGGLSRMCWPPPVPCVHQRSAVQSQHQGPSLCRWLSVVPPHQDGRGRRVSTRWLQQAKWTGKQTGRCT